MLTLLILLAAMEVDHAAATGFTSRNVVRIERDIDDAYGALTEGIGNWWNPDHTYSGDSKNMSLEATAGGCLCEQLPDGGSVEHMHVLFVDPGKTLRLSGGLGPLQEMAVNGAMTFHLEASGAVTQVTLTYVVSGYRADGMAMLAEPVDAVLAGQLTRLKAYLDAP